MKCFLCTTKDGKASNWCICTWYILLSRWDEWVNFDRLVELDQEGLTLKKKLAAEHKSNDKDISQTSSLEDYEQVNWARSSLF